MSLSVNLEHHGAYGTLILQGELDASTVSLLPPAVEDVLRAGERHLIIDTAQLQFCDTTGLEALLAAQRAMVEANATMRLTHVHGMLHRVLKLTGLERAFTFTADDGSAHGCGGRMPGFTRWT
jgi:anti-sigma B factor antagonist